MAVLGFDGFQEKILFRKRDVKLSPSLCSPNKLRLQDKKVSSSGSRCLFRSIENNSKSTDRCLSRQSNRKATGVPLRARHLRVCFSASTSPAKPVTTVCRMTASALGTPDKHAARSTNSSSSPSDPYQNETFSTGSSNESVLSHVKDGPENNTPRRPSEEVFDDTAEFATCDQCSRVHQGSLDLWIDHLGERHPLPHRWPSARADILSKDEQRNPYTAVVGSHKKRKADATPRPLNSFMIFAQYLRRVTLRFFPDAHNVHISQRVGSLWRKLDNDLREQYAMEARRLQLLHAIEFPHYKYQPKKRTRSSVDEKNTDDLLVSHPVKSNQRSVISSDVHKPITSEFRPIYVAKDLTPTNIVGVQCFPSSYICTYLPDDSGANSRKPIKQSSKTEGSVIHESATSYYNSSSGSLTELCYYDSVPPPPPPSATGIEYHLPSADSDFSSPNELDRVEPTLTVLVAGDQVEQQSTMEDRHSSGHVLDKPAWTTEINVHRKTVTNVKTGTLEDLLNAPSIFQVDQKQSNSVKLEPLQVITSTVNTATDSLLLTDFSYESTTPILTPLEAPKSMDSFGNRGLDQTRNGTITPSISSASPESIEHDERSVLGAGYWGNFKQDVADLSDLKVPQDGSLVNKANNSGIILLGPFQTADRWTENPIISENNDSASCLNPILSMRTCTTSIAVGLPSATSVLADVNKRETTDVSLAFDDIDTCGQSPSLEELGRLILFNSGWTSETGDAAIRDRVNYKLTEAELHPLKCEPIVIKKEDQSCDDACIPVGDHYSMAPLPSIESWTFGGYSGYRAS